MGQPVYCTEARVREIVNMEMSRHVARYEMKVGSPRHAANQAWLNQISGGITVLKWIGSALLVVSAVATVVLAVRHH